MIQRGHRLPHFAATTVDRRTVEYSTIWQHRNLVLVTLPPGESHASSTYIAALTAATEAFLAEEAECVITRTVIPGISCPAVVIADRWGEVVHVAPAGLVDDLLSPAEILEWLVHVRHRCPECEGETK